MGDKENAETFVVRGFGTDLGNFATPVKSSGKLSAKTPHRTPLGKLVENCTRSSLSQAHFQEHGTHKCKKCEDTNAALAALEALHVEKDREIHALNVALTNEREDAKEYQKEFERIQEEGQSLYQTYNQKCLKLKELGAKYTETKSQLEAQAQQIETLGNEKSAASDDASRWAEKYHAQQRDFSERLTAYKRLMETHAALVEEQAKLTAQLDEERAAMSRNQAELEDSRRALEENRDLIAQLQETKAALESVAAAPSTPGNKGEMFQFTPKMRAVIDAAVLAYTPNRPRLSFDADSDDDEFDAAEEASELDTARLQLEALQGLLTQRAAACADYEAQISTLAVTNGDLQARMTSYEEANAALMSQLVDTRKAALTSAASLESVTAAHAALQNTLNETSAQFERERAAAQAAHDELTVSRDRLSGHLADAQLELGRVRAGFAAEINALKVQLADASRAATVVAPPTTDNAEPSELRDQLETASMRNEMLRDTVKSLEADVEKLTEQLADAVETADGAKLRAEEATAAYLAKSDSLAKLREEYTNMVAECLAQKELVQEAQADADKLRGELADSAAQVEQLTFDYNEATGAVDETKALLGAVSAELAEVSGALDALKAQNATASARNEGVLQEEAALKKKLADKDGVIATLENDLRLTLKKHKKDMAELNERFHHDDYKQRYADAVLANQRMQEKLSGLADVYAEIEALHGMQDTLSAALVSQSSALAAAHKSEAARQQEITEIEITRYEVEEKLASATQQLAVAQQEAATAESARAQVASELAAATEELHAASFKAEALACRVDELNAICEFRSERIQELEFEANTFAAEATTASSEAFFALAAYGALQAEFTNVQASQQERLHRAADNKADVTRIEGELQRAAAEHAEVVEFMEIEAEEMRNSLADLKSQLAVAEQALGEAKESCVMLETELDVARQEVESLTAAQRVATASLEEAQARAALYAAERDTVGETSSTQVAELQRQLTVATDELQRCEASLANSMLEMAGKEQELTDALTAQLEISTQHSVLLGEMDEARVLAETKAAEALALATRVAGLETELRAAKDSARASDSQQMLALKAQLLVAQNANNAANAVLTEARTQLVAVQTENGRLQADQEFSEGELTRLRTLEGEFNTLVAALARIPELEAQLQGASAALLEATSTRDNLVEVVARQEDRVRALELAERAAEADKEQLIHQLNVLLETCDKAAGSVDPAAAHRLAAEKGAVERELTATKMQLGAMQEGAQRAVAERDQLKGYLVQYRKAADEKVKTLQLNLARAEAEVEDLDGKFGAVRGWLLSHREVIANLPGIEGIVARL